jgi:catechol 2,3-dioxygenase-like lactoylglutathione lyase family enzyme
MITGIRHVGLVVADLQKSIEFWCETMGFSIVRRMEESGPHIDAMMGLKNVEVETAKLSASDGNLLELLCFHSHPDKRKWEGKPYSTGLTHIALTVQDMDQTLRRLNRAGFPSSFVPQLSPDGQVKVVYVGGPEGVLMELVEVIKNEPI